jgi:hypothetical protein
MIWHPIATAPLERPVLLATSSEFLGLGAGNVESCWHLGVRQSRLVWRSIAETVYGSDDNEFLNAPTHWAEVPPLPAVPA